MARQGVHRYCTPALTSRQSSAYHRSKLLRCVGASLDLKQHIDDITQGFVSQQARAAILRWKSATDEAQPYVTDRGDE